MSVAELLTLLDGWGVRYPPDATRDRLEALASRLAATTREGRGRMVGALGGTGPRRRCHRRRHPRSAQRSTRSWSSTTTSTTRWDDEEYGDDARECAWATTGWDDEYDGGVGRPRFAWRRQHNYQIDDGGGGDCDSGDDDDDDDDDDGEVDDDDGDGEGNTTIKYIPRKRRRDGRGVR